MLMDSRQRRFILDPFGSGLMRPVNLIQTPAPHGFRLRYTQAGEPAYVSANEDLFVQLLETVDPEDRAWRHAFVALPAPIDYMRAMELCALFLGQGVKTWSDQRKGPLGSGYAMVRFHQCMSGTADGPPAPWQAPRADGDPGPSGTVMARLSHLRLVSSAVTA
jgi:hypothetical protein